MVRQQQAGLRLRRSVPAELLPGRGRISREELTRRWLDRLRLALPDGGTLVLTIHRETAGTLRLSLRANLAGETLVSEVRTSSEERGLIEAGLRLERRLRLLKPAERPWLGRWRELFRKAG